MIIIAMNIDLTRFYYNSDKEHKTKKTLEIFDVNLNDVLMKPHLYNNKVIKVKGYYHISFENSSLAPIKNSFNAIWVELLTNDTIIYKLNNKEIKQTLEKYFWRKNNFFNEKYVEVIGLFDNKDKGHMNAFKGTIKDLKEFRILSELDSSVIKK